MGYGQAIKNGRAVAGLITLVVTVFVLGPIITECSEMPGSPELQLGQRVMYQMAGRANLRQVDFFETHDRALPSDFVKLVSDPDHALWPPPPGRRELTDGVRTTKANRIRMPDGVVFSPNSRQTTDSDEIVFRADDENRQLLVIGYSPGDEEPTFEYDWDFPTKAGEVPID